MFFNFLFLVDEQSNKVIGPIPAYNKDDKTYYKVIYVKKFEHFIFLNGHDDPVIQATNQYKQRSTKK